jgi:poly-gamma-glutamate system protein
MRRRHGKVNRWTLVALAVISLAFFSTITRTMHIVRSRSYDVKLTSARLSKQAFAVIREYQQQRGVPLDSVNDPNGTGLIGLQFSQLAYGRSDLSDALTTTNPNFSAVLVEMLGQAGVRRGDTIAVSWDGTYPALNVQLLAVAKTMGLVPVIVTAQSAGMWGANYPGLSWLDIERLLADAGLWDFRSRIATIGGETDDGRGLSPEGRLVLAAAAESAGVPVMSPTSVEGGVDRRLAVYGGFRALVSIGRAVVDAGDPLAKVPSRVIADRVRRNPYRGLIGAVRQKGIPVLHIGNPSQVALAYHLPVAPVPMPEPGRGRLFFERRYSVVLAAVFAVLLALLLLMAVRYNVESYFGAKVVPGEKEAV